jgi:superfamily I DNA/RNA helicase
VSVFNGPEPQVLFAETEAAEIWAVAAFLRAALSDGVAAREIGVFVRDHDRRARARATAVATGRKPLNLLNRSEDPGEHVSIGTMHLAKGLEF